MFNADRKEKFMSEVDKHTTVAQSLFRSTQVFEAQYNTDLCNLDTGSLNIIVSQHAKGRLKTTENIIRILRYYGEWCNENGYQINPDILSLEIPSAENIVSDKVGSDIQLRAILDTVYPRLDGERDCLTRCYFWMAFMGMASDDIYDVKTSDVHLDEMVIYFNRESYAIPEEARTDIYNACTLEKFIISRSTQLVPTYAERYNNDYLLRGATKERLSDDAIPIAIRHARTSHGVILKYNRIYSSGVFFREYAHEMMGVPTGFTEEIQKVLKRRKIDQKNIKEVRKVATETSNNLTKEYELWKAAFYPSKPNKRKKAKPSK